MVIIKLAIDHIIYHLPLPQKCVCVVFLFVMVSQSQIWDLVTSSRRDSQHRVSAILCSAIYTKTNIRLPCCNPFPEPLS